MSDAWVSEQATKTLTVPQARFIVGILTTAFLAFLVYFAVYRISSPPVVSAEAPDTEFSAARAMRHVETIARRPHPIGSSEHSKVRAYIQSELQTLGLTPQQQVTTVVGPNVGRRIQAGTVHNVIGRLTGTGIGASVLLMAHYDSTQTSSGASDNGASVAALLETLRALKASQPLNNDVIFLFTDAEETGLLGARAFVEEHEWAKDVKTVLNFEARGTKGPSLMFETSSENGWLIRLMAEAAPTVVTSSLFSEIYKRLPNSTDFSVFKEAGFAGLNFAYTDGFAHYHTLSDNVENIDRRSLQHHGLYALSLTQALGNANLENPKAPNDVYFSIPGLLLIHYSERWIIPLAAANILLLAVVLVIGLRRKHLKISEVLLGFLALFATGIAAAVAVTIVNLLIRNIHTEYRLIPQGTTYNNELYVISYISIALGVALTLFNLFRKRLSISSLTTGGLIWCAILTGVTSWWTPGGSYLFGWPLLFSLIALGLVFVLSLPGDFSTKYLPVFAVAAVPAIVLLAPIIYLLSLGLSLSLFRAVLVLLVLLTALLLPLVDFITRANKWVLPAIALVIGLTFIVQGHRTTQFTRDDPKPTDLLYALNGDSGKAVWASLNRPDEWTSQMFPEGSETSPIPEYVSFPRGFLHSSAPSVDLAPPIISSLNDVTENGERRLSVNVRSQRQAPIISFSVESETEILGASINGKRVASQSRLGGPAQPEMRLMGPAPEGPGQTRRPRWGFTYYAPPEQGIDVALETKSSEAIRIRVLEQSYGLPESLLNSLKPRPDNMMPAPYPYSPYADSTILSKHFTLAAPSENTERLSQH